MSTRRSGSAAPAGLLKSSAFAIVKIVVFAPMPIDSERTAVSANSGFRRSSRVAYLPPWNHSSTIPASAQPYYGPLRQEVHMALQSAAMKKISRRAVLATAAGAVAFGGKMRAQEPAGLNPAKRPGRAPRAVGERSTF